jgi:LemA protein
MKKGMIIGLSIAGGIILLLLILVMWGVGSYNKLVNLNEAVNSSWSQVTEARAKVSQMNVTKEVLNDPQAFAKFQQLQGNLSGALSRLLVTVENYPNLKANENFLQLQAQLEGTENRISVERRNFNEVVQQYNVSIRRFPTSIFAGMFGFRYKEYFKSTAGSETPPKVEF